MSVLLAVQSLGARRIVQNVTYMLAEDGTIVFTVEIDDFGPAVVKSARKGVFSCRVNDTRVLRIALQAAEAFADAHEAELAPRYEEIARQWALRSVA